MRKTTELDVLKFKSKHHLIFEILVNIINRSIKVAMVETHLINKSEHIIVIIRHLKNSVIQ